MGPETSEPHRRQEPSWRAYGIAFTLAGVTGFLLALNWLSLALAGVAAFIAACGALVGTGGITTIVEGIVYAAIVCALFAIVPKPPWVVLIAAGFIGAAIGGTCVGAWWERR